MALSTLKVILVLALSWGVPARHGDIPNTYVKAFKEEHSEIFFAVLQGMIVCEETLKQLGVHLYDSRNPFYELNQAGRLWSELLDAKLVDAGFSRCVSDAGLYFRRHKFELTVVSVYVNDLLVNSSHNSLGSFFDYESTADKDSG